MASETEDQTAQNWLKEAQKGYIRIGILILLSRNPCHGYEIMKEFKNRTKGLWQPTPGGVYPILRDLEQSGYIKGQWQTQRNRKLKIYKITPSGEAILKRAILKQAEISDNIGKLFQEFARDVLNVKVTNVPVPSVHSFFSSFLEDKDAKEENLEELEIQRKHLKEAMYKMRQHLDEINRKISEKKKQKEAEQTAS